MYCSNCAERVWPADVAKKFVDTWENRSAGVIEEEIATKVISDHNARRSGPTTTVDTGGLIPPQGETIPNEGGMFSQEDDELMSQITQ